MKFTSSEPIDFPEILPVALGSFFCLGWRKVAIMCLCAITFLSVYNQSVLSFAQPSDVDEEEPPIVIKREALILTPAKKYKVGLQLRPSIQITLVAPEDGTVQIVNKKEGEKVRRQSEILRLDDARATLVLKAAEARIATGQKQVEIAKKSKDPLAVELAELKLKTIEAEKRIAQHDADKLVFRTPFEGVVSRIFAKPGQYVQLGEPLIEVTNSNILFVEIPAERKTAKVNSEVEIQIEYATVKAKVVSVYPLTKETEHVRELLESAVTARVEIKNAQGEFHPGQSVYPPAIPRLPVTQIPNSVLSNGEEGQRKVQVIRENVIRDIAVQLHGSVGESNVMVSGAFLKGDELVKSTSQPLADGTAVAPATPQPEGSGKNRKTGSSRRQTGF